MFLYDVAEGTRDRAIEEITGVIYAQSDTGDPLRMNILHGAEPTKTPRPAMVWIHGGGWGWRGIKDTYLQGAYVNYPFALEGYFTAAIEYTLSPRAPFPAQIHDCKAAIRWLRAHASQYNIDPDRIGVWGRSAGGHLCNLLGTTGEVKDLEGTGGWGDYPSHVNAVLDYFGPTDLASIAGPHNGDKEAHIRNLLSLFFDGPIEERLSLAQRANPIRYVTPQAAPFLIIHGEQDLPVPISQGKALHEALLAHGVPSTFVRVNNAAHGLLPSPPGSTIDPALPELYAHIRDFLEKYL